MTTASSQGLQRRDSMVPAILVTGLAVGIMDGLAAVLNAFLRSGILPERVFRYIASALLGKQAYSGGGEMIALGILLHFAIALLWSMIFFIAYPKLRFLQGNKWITGAGYGLFVWLMMNLVILPLTALPVMPFNREAVITGILIHMLVVGLPVVLMTRRWFEAKI